MKKCLLCKKEFKNWTKIDNKWRNINNRKYCFECSPWGSKNRRRLTCRFQDMPKPLYDYKNASKKEKKLINKRTTKYQEIKRRERRSILIHELGGKCEICGYDKNMACLEFHHIDPKTKLFAISGHSLYGKSMKTLRLEIKKCKLLCCRCHREEHNPNYFPINIKNIQKTYY